MTTTFSEFLTVLDRMAVVPAELQASLESSTLTESQMAVLRHLANHLIGPESQPHPASSARSISPSADPWKAFHRCSHLLLDPVYQRILASGPQQFVGCYRDVTVYDGVMSASRNAGQQAVERLRGLLISLALYDIGRFRFQSFTGKRLSDRMKDELQSLLPEGDVVEQYKAGKNLAHICDEFGMGCVLYLASLLSNDFLCKKFTASGRYHDGAFEHLSSLHLKQLGQDSGANNFIEKSRALSVIYLKMRTSQS